MIGHHSRLRDVMRQSYSICIYACAHANHVRYSSIYVTFCGSSKQFVKVILGKTKGSCKLRVDAGGED